MASNEDSAAIVSAYNSVFTDDCCGIAAAVFLVYEFAVTFADEVKLFWGKGLTGASVLFFLNRYTSLLYSLWSLTSFGMVKDMSCSAGTKFSAFLEVFQYVPWAGFSALRTYALSRNKPLSALVLFLSLVPVGVNAAFYSFQSSVVIHPFGCTAMSPFGLRATTAFVIASRGSLIAADILLIAVTWAKLSHRSGLRSEYSFADVLRRDGTIYFICLLTLNSLHLAFTLLSIAETSFERGSDIVGFTEPLTAILVWRFMLDLQAVNRRTLHLGSQVNADVAGQMQSGGSVSSSPCESIVFERVIGSLGSFVADDRADVDDYDCVVEEPFQDSVEPEEECPSPEPGSSGIQRE